MAAIIQSIATNFAYKEIVNFCVNNKDTTDSPSTLRKILGGVGSGSSSYDSSNRIEKILTTNSHQNQMLLYATIIKSAQGQHQQQQQARKADLQMSKYEIPAIDIFIKEMAYIQFNNLSDIIFKLSEICEKDLHIMRAIYKYILITQLDGLRLNQTGSLIMRNYDNGIESVNTIFSRICRLVCV
jgi:hypothetical protein